MTKEQEIIEGLKPVCICKGIRTSVFLKHIRAGMKTVEELQKATGAGGGSCKGERCTLRIRELLVKERAAEASAGATGSRRHGKK